MRDLASLRALSNTAICTITLGPLWFFRGYPCPPCSQHDLLVSGVDWHPVTNKIVTCSHDRNAFVWQYDAATDSWQPTVAMLRINRAALDVKWAPDGKALCCHGVVPRLPSLSPRLG